VTTPLRTDSDGGAEDYPLGVVDATRGESAEEMEMAKKHRHTVATRSDPTGYVYCVAPHNCNPAAHGGIVQTETCACGAMRTRASTGFARSEYGPWSVPVGGL